jgi:hypothetical protein
MSFAFSAALFDDNNDSDFINNKRKHSKTQKNYRENFDTGKNFDKGKVNSVLEAVHKNQKPEDDEDEPRNFFSPPEKPISSGSEKAGTKESMMNMTKQNDVMFRTLGSAPQPTNQENNDLDLNNYSNYGDKKTVEEYYKKMLPGYNANNQNSQNNQNANPSNRLYHRMNYDQASNVAPTQDVLLQKLNYMISLLEDQQDEKTNNVTEEVVLYSFLGIFIIFIVDSFAKVGKYVR